MSEIVKSEYNALDEQGNYKTHYFKTSADQVVGLGRMKNTAYSVGDVVYSDTNNKVALKCITGGTTSNAELDISTKNIGDSVTDGSVVWQVCNRTSDVTSVNGKTGDVVVDILPVGTIISYAGNTTPNGFLDCNGASLNPSTYTNLFNEIGTTYGGDGSATFNLPNLNNGSFLEGSNDVGVVKEAGLPNIQSWIRVRRGYDGATVFGYSETERSGALSFSISDGPTFGYGLDARTLNTASDTLRFDAKKSNTIYKDDITTVQPKAVTVKFCIKY
jgi:hypothetical protein